MLERFMGPWNEPAVRRVFGPFETAMNRFLEPGGMREQAAFPALSIIADANDARVTALLPGVKPEDLEIHVLGDTVRLSGRRDVGERTGVWHRRERFSGRFSRTFRLPFRVDAEAVKSNLKDGILSLELSRPAADRPRRIAVQVH